MSVTQNALQITIQIKVLYCMFCCELACYVIQHACCGCQMLVVDIDGGRLLHSYGDECDIIPRKLHKALVSAIKDDSGCNIVLAVLLLDVHRLTCRHCQQQ